MDVLSSRIVRLEFNQPATNTGCEIKRIDMAPTLETSSGAEIKCGITQSVGSNTGTIGTQTTGTPTNPKRGRNLGGGGPSDEPGTVKVGGGSSPPVVYTLCSDLILQLSNVMEIFSCTTPPATGSFSGFGLALDALRSDNKGVIKKIKFEVDYDTSYNPAGGETFYKDATSLTSTSPMQLRCADGTYLPTKLGVSTHDIKASAVVDSASGEITCPAFWSSSGIT